MLVLPSFVLPICRSADLPTADLPTCRSAHSPSCSPSASPDKLARLTQWRRGAVLAGEKLPKLVELMAHLRGPEGCAWDRAQDYDTLKGLMIEEAYEVIDAVSERDFKGLEDELGDLLFQVVFYSRLAEEEGRFNIDGVVEAVYAKLIRRHPHVFGEVRARDAGEALKSWLRVKEQERAATAQKKNGERSILDGIAASMPATLVAYELGLRAAEVGFDWKTAEDVLEKVEEEIREIRHELRAPTEPAATLARRSRLEEEVGDLLFSVANLARFVRSDPETCLRKANQKFMRRFQAMEREIVAQGKKLQDCSLEEMESLWNELKSKE